MFSYHLKRQPEKFLSGVVCAHVKPTGTLQIAVDGRSVDIPLDVAERLTGWMVENYGETSDFSDEVHLRQAAANLSEDIL